MKMSFQARFREQVGEEAAKMKAKATFPVLILAGLLVLGLLSASLANAGPLSAYYLTGVDSAGTATIFVFQGNSLVRWWHTASYGEWLIAVSSGTVRTQGAGAYYGGGEDTLGGAQYTLDGQFLRSDPALPSPQTIGFGDGTTDGTHNYAVTSVPDAGVVYQFDLDWQNPVELFHTSLFTRWGSGITYDGTNNSLWVSGFRQIADYSMGGTLLSSFDTTPVFEIFWGSTAALALDPADNTLWTTAGGYSLLENWSKTGELLSAQWYPNLPGGQLYGGEFGPVPEPGSLLLLGTGLLGASRLLRRKRQ